MTGLNDLAPDAAMQQVMDTARALAKLRGTRCDFCGRVVRMERAIVLGIELQRCPACLCEGFAP